MGSNDWGRMKLKSLFFLFIYSYAFDIVHLEVLQNKCCAWTAMLHNYLPNYSCYYNFTRDPVWIQIYVLNLLRESTSTWHTVWCIITQLILISNNSQVYFDNVFTFTDRHACKVLDSAGSLIYQITYCYSVSY
jgi:hypothetical protein